jgi:hypothetical protein
VAADPGETNNVATGQGELIDSTRLEVEQWVDAAVGERRFAAPAEGLSNEAVRALKGWGTLNDSCTYLPVTSHISRSSIVNTMRPTRIGQTEIRCAQGQGIFGGCADSQKSAAATQVAATSPGHPEANRSKPSHEA